MIKKFKTKKAIKYILKHPELFTEGEQYVKLCKKNERFKEENMNQETVSALYWATHYVLRAVLTQTIRTTELWRSLKVLY